MRLVTHRSTRYTGDTLKAWIEPQVMQVQADAGKNELRKRNWRKEVVYSGQRAVLQGIKYDMDEF